ncbi:hypothetical protein HY009_01580 [Candidatus Acetothermia bacterium]|nr:hypothetical protein [Candidatus Acetothermia bacterium]
MNQFTHRVVMALATFALAIATGSVGTVLTAKAAEAISSSSVLIEQQAAGVRFSVQDESTVALRLEVLSLDGRRIFQSEWRPDKTVVWSAALITGQTVANGVYLYAISVRDREGREQRKLGKLVLVQGLEPRLSIPAVSELVTTEPAAAQFPLTAGTSWSQRLGIDRSDTYRILRRPARVPGGPVTSFEQLLQLGANGRLHITELCLGTVFAPFTAQNPDNLSNGGDCRSSWSGVTGGGTSNGWTDDGAIVRLATASDKVGIGTTTPAQALEVNGIASLGAPGGVYGYLFAAPSPGPYPTLGFNTYGAPFYLAGVAGYGGILQFQDGDGKLIYYTGSNVAAGAAHVNTPRFAIDKDGNVGVGTTTPTAKLSVQTGTGFYGFIHTDGAIVVGSYVGGSASGAVGGWPSRLIA